MIAVVRASAAADAAILLPWKRKPKFRVLRRRKPVKPNDIHYVGAIWGRAGAVQSRCAAGPSMQKRQAMERSAGS